MGVCTAIGGIIGALLSLFGLWLANRSQNRRHTAELGIRIALAKFEYDRQLAQQLANMTHKMQETPPFNAFLIDGIRLMDIVSNRRLSPEQMAERIGSLADFTKTFADAITAEFAKQDRQGY